MTIAIHLTKISTFAWSENDKSVTKPPCLEASSRRVAIVGPNGIRLVWRNTIPVHP